MSCGPPSGDGDGTGSSTPKSAAAHVAAQSSTTSEFSVLPFPVNHKSSHDGMSSLNHSDTVSGHVVAVAYAHAFGRRRSSIPGPGEGSGSSGAGVAVPNGAHDAPHASDTNDSGTNPRMGIAFTMPFGMPPKGSNH